MQDRSREPEPPKIGLRAVLVLGGVLIVAALIGADWVRPPAWVERVVGLLAIGASARFALGAPDLLAWVGFRLRRRAAARSRRSAGQPPRP